MLDIPANWKAALSAVQTMFPEAVIGGGCLRDLDNGRPVKDIDIFIRGTTANELDLVHGRLKSAGYEADDIDPSKMYPVGDGNDVVGHFEAEFANVDVPVQIIMVNWDTSKICDRFDFGICKIAFDGVTVTRTQDYEDDKINQVFRLCRERTNAEMVASIHRFARLTKKYEGWSFELFNDGADDDEQFGLIF